MPVKSYRLSPLAADDLEEIWLYTLRQWSLAQADSYLRTLVAAFEELAAGQKQSRKVEARPGYLKCTVGSHVIFLRDQGDRLEIIRILHQKQDAEHHI